MLFLSQIIPSTADGGLLERIGAIQFTPVINGSDSTGGSDIWGWTGPDGTEYAIMGVAAGVAIVNTKLMKVVSVVPGPLDSDSFFRRDIKTYRHYAYVVSENTGNNEGLMVIDLQLLPDTVMFIGSFPIDNAGGVRSHNLTIDTSKAFAYIEGEKDSVISIFDLTDPENPVYVAEFPNSGIHIHDLYARNDTLYLAEIENKSFSVWNVTDKLMPELLVRKDIPNAVNVHNVWPTDDGRYLLSTEESAGRTVKMWDISKLNADEINITDEWLGTSNLAHNVHIKGNYAFVSHYESGIHVIDISDPDNIFQNAWFDTYAQSNNAGFRGAFGVYPFTQNGTVFVSNIEGRLSVLSFDPDAVLTDIEETPLLSQPFLVNNYPNPFNPATTIEYSLPVSGEVSLLVYNIKGEQVANLYSGVQSAGEHQIKWDASNAASGLYFYRLRAGDFVSTKKMVLLK